MAATIPTYEPEKIIKGSTVKFTISLPDYLPADGWTLTYAFTHASGYGTVVATNNGDGTHLVTVSKTVTATWTAGWASYQAYVEKGTERFALRRGTWMVEADYGAAALDARTVTKEMLDDVEAAMLIKANKTANVSSYSIAARSMAHYAWSELYALRDRLRADLMQEKRRERVARGLGHDGTVKVRFG